MQISTTDPSPQTFTAVATTNPAAWVQACTGNVEMAARAAELVYGCFRTIAAQQSALAARVMMLATNGMTGDGAVGRPMQPTRLSYQSCDMVIGSLIEALEAVRQASQEIQMLVLQQVREPPAGGRA